MVRGGLSELSGACVSFKIQKPCGSTLSTGPAQSYLYGQAGRAVQVGTRLQGAILGRAVPEVVRLKSAYSLGSKIRRHVILTARLAYRHATAATPHMHPELLVGDISACHLGRRAGDMQTVWKSLPGCELLGVSAISNVCLLQYVVHVESSCSGHGLAAQPV